MQEVPSQNSYNNGERFRQAGFGKLYSSMEPFISYVTEEELRRERARARELRQTQWWKRKCARGECYYCGKKVKPGDLTMDHIVPLVRGGKSTKGNIVPVCKGCNDRKKYFLPLEWEEYLERLRKEEE